MENEPKQLTDGLLPDWNNTVSDYAVREWNEAKHRVEACGCGSCKGRLTVAEDRMDFLLNIGEWHLSNRKSRTLRDNENQLPNNSDPDDKQVA